MADYLVYWRGYWKDIAHQEINRRWNTKNDAFFQRVQQGDNLWLVVTAGTEYPNEWRLLQRIVVADKGKNPPGQRYGHNRIEGNETEGVNYDLES